MDQGSKMTDYFKKAFVNQIMLQKETYVELVSMDLNSLCRAFDFYEVKKNIIFQNEKGNTFTLLIIFIVKSFQKEQNNTNLLL